VQAANFADPSLNESDLIAFLSDGASYGLPGEPVERIETHCSIVFMIGETAYKLKRPLAFSSVDYTTLEKREMACRRELALNLRSAPDLYLGLRSIRRDAHGHLSFDDDGVVVDWVVVMRRFAQSALFDHLVAEGRFTLDLAETLAREIARFQGGAERTSAFGGAEGLRRATESNRRDQRTVSVVLQEEGIEQLYARSLATVERLASLLDQRRADGCVRVCHGDLRLANICLYRGRPTLFDAIEFSDEISCIDVLYDVAFLLMDLCHQGRHAEANRVFNTYLDATGDDRGLPSLPLMMSLRAGTRAYALAASSLRKTDPEQRDMLSAKARDLMALAMSLFETASPLLVVIGGGTRDDRHTVAGSMAPSFLPAPGARILEATDMSADGFENRLTEITAAGYTLISPGAFETEEQRRKLSRLVADRGIRLIGLWLAPDRNPPPRWHAIGNRDAAAIAHVLRQGGTIGSV